MVRASLVCSICLILLLPPGFGRAEVPVGEPGPAGWRDGEPKTIELVVPPSVALPAEEPAPAGWPPTVTINELVERSTEFFRNKNYLESAIELELAYAIDPQPVFLFNMAQGVSIRRSGPPSDRLLPAIHDDVTDAPLGS